MGSLGNEEQVDVTNSPVLTVEDGSHTEISDNFYGCKLKLFMGPLFVKVLR